MKTFYGPVEYHDGDTSVRIQHGLDTMRLASVTLWKCTINNCGGPEKTPCIADMTVSSPNTVDLRFGNPLGDGVHYEVGIVAA